MAGITDLPFRKICKNLGAGLVVSEMTAANPDTWNSKKTKNYYRRLFRSITYPYFKQKDWDGSCRYDFVQIGFK